MAAYFTAAQRSARRASPRSAATSPAQPQREGHAGAAVAVAVHDAALGLQAHRRTRGPQADSHADHRRAVQGGDERGAARADGRRRRRVGRAVLGALLRGAAEHDVVLARDDVDQPPRIGLVEQPLLSRRAPVTRTTWPAHRRSATVAGELAGAQAGAVDDGVGVELVEPAT